MAALKFSRSKQGEGYGTPGFTGRPGAGVIDGMAFPTLEVGFAWSDPEAAIADAKAHIDRFKPRFAYS